MVNRHYQTCPNCQCVCQERPIHDDPSMSNVLWEIYCAKCLIKLSHGWRERDAVKKGQESKDCK